MCFLQTIHPGKNPLITFCDVVAELLAFGTPGL